MEHRTYWQCDSCGHRNSYFPADGAPDACGKCERELHACDDCGNNYTTRVYADDAVPRYVCEDCRFAIARARKRGLAAPAPVTVRIVPPGVGGGGMKVQW